MTSVTAIRIRLSQHLGRIELQLQTDLINGVLNFPDDEHVKLGSRVFEAGEATPCDQCLLEISAGWLGAIVRVAER